MFRVLADITPLQDQANLMNSIIWFGEMFGGTCWIAQVYVLCDSSLYGLNMVELTLMLKTCYIRLE